MLINWCYQMKQICLFQHVVDIDTKINWINQNYRTTSNIEHTLIGNKIVDHSDAAAASPVGAAPTASSFST